MDIRAAIEEEAQAATDDTVGPGIELGGGTSVQLLYDYGQALTVHQAQECGARAFSSIVLHISYLAAP